jgi:hypothetical protein
MRTDHLELLICQKKRYTGAFLPLKDLREPPLSAAQQAPQA